MKKFCVFPIFVFLLFGSFVYAQKLNKGAHTVEGWKEFAAEDGSFKVLFPKLPEIYLKAGDLRSKRMNFFSSNVSPTERYSLRFTDYPAPIIDEMERRVEYGYEAEKASTKVVMSQGFSGIEYVTDSTSLKTTYTTRRFIVKQREFRLEVITPLLGKLPSALRQSYQRKIDTFFNSFIIGEIPPAEYTAIPMLPEDLGSNLQENVYSNKYFGFKISIPPNMKIDYLNQGKMTPSEKLEYEKESIGQRWLSKNNPKLILALKEPMPASGAYSGLLIQAFRPDSSANVSLREFTDYRKASEEVHRGILNLPVQPVNINGKNFLMFEIKIMTYAEPKTTLPLKERWYITDRNRVFLTFSFRYRDEVEEKLMMESLKTLTFFDSTRGE